MRIRKILCISLVCGALFTLLTGCGNSSAQVPDSVIQSMLILGCEYYDPSADWSWTATHDIDKEAHTDRVMVELTVEYEYGTVTLTNTSVFQYDRSSDLWKLLRLGEWSEPVYKFNSNLKGDWTINYFDSVYEITVKSVTGDEITLECYIEEDAIGGGYCIAEGGGTFDLNGGTRVEVPIQLPDGFFVSWMHTSSRENKWETELNIKLNIAEGVSSAYIYPEISAD